MTHAPIDRDVQAVEEWYLNQVRPFLERLDKIDAKAGRVEGFDAELERLRKTRDAYDDDLVVCFLGMAGVGKSTLINALVDGRQSILPNGGIGPLTAQAPSVRRGSEPGFQVRYHTRGAIWKLIFALDWGARDNIAAVPSQEVRSTRIEPPKDGSLTQDEIQDIEDAQGDDGQGDLSRAQSLRKQAQLLIKGRQDSEATVGYLVDSLRAVLGMEPKWGNVPNEDDLPRVERLREALAAGERHRVGSVSDERFRQELTDHAAGFLAPIIKEMNVIASPTRSRTVWCSWTCRASASPATSTRASLAVGSGSGRGRSSSSSITGGSTRRTRNSSRRAVSSTG